MEGRGGCPSNSEMVAPSTVRGPIRWGVWGSRGGGGNGERSGGVEGGVEEGVGQQLPQRQVRLVALPLHPGVIGAGGGVCMGQGGEFVSLLTT